MASRSSPAAGPRYAELVGGGGSTNGRPAADVLAETVAGMVRSAGLPTTLRIQSNLSLRGGWGASPWRDGAARCRSSRGWDGRDEDGRFAFSAGPRSARTR